MEKKFGYLAYDLHIFENVMIHSDQEYMTGEIVEVKLADKIHECKILEVYREE